ncbi:MAG TPA: MFS transporter [Anaerolineae bacterium]|nr:MFS transporter [Anaerolineae bacterium]
MSKKGGKRAGKRRIRPSLARLSLGAGRRVPLRTALARLASRLPWRRPRPTIEEQNLWNLYVDTVWFGVLNGIATTFVSVFAIRLGASNREIGWLAALPALINVFWLIPSARLIERQRRRLPIILLTGFLQRLGYLLIALMPLFIHTHRVEAVIFLNALITLPTAIINVAITSLMADLTSIEKRARMVSIRNVLLSFVSMIVVLAGGRFLDLITFPLNYQLLFGLGAGISMLSLYYLKRIRVPDAVIARRQVRPRELLTLRLRRLVRTVAGQRDFTRFAGAIFVFHWGLYLPSALYSIYRVRDLHASDAWVGLLAMVLSATTILSYLWWGKMTEKRGNRLVLIVSSLGLALYPTLTGLSPRLEPLIIVSVIGGVFSASYNLSSFNFMLEVCPPEHRPSYVATYTSLVNVTAFLAPLLGTFLADLSSVRTALLIAGGVRLIGAGFLYGLLPSSKTAPVESHS